MQVVVLEVVAQLQFGIFAILPQQLHDLLVQLSPGGCIFRSHALQVFLQPSVVEVYHIGDL